MSAAGGRQQGAASRAVLACAGIGVLALACTWLLAAAGGVQVMPSYLAAWLFWLALPAGALPLVIGLDLAGSPARAWPAQRGVVPPSPLDPSLRLLLMGLPLAALLVVPVLLAQPTLFTPDAVRHSLGTGPGTGFARAWLSPGARALRSVVLLVLWSALALVFLRPGRPRGLAVFGFGAHLVVGTLLATDLAMAVAPGLNSSSYGLLLISSQCGIALSVAILLAAIGRARLPDSTASMMLWLLGVWLFLQFTQYLIVWSANLPREIVWYQQRDAGLGRAAEWFGLAAFVVPLLTLVSRRLARSTGVLALLAGLVLVMHLLETLWLITPTFRGSFTLSLADVLSLLGVGGLVLAPMLFIHARSVQHSRIVTP